MDGAMTEALDPQIGEDLLKGRSAELDGDVPQSIQTRLEAARVNLANAIQEAKAAIQESPATPLFEAKLAEDASVISARIDVTDEGKLVVVYSVAEQDEASEDRLVETPSSSGASPLTKAPKARGKKASTAKNAPAALLLELEQMLGSSKSGYRGLPLPRMREIADLLGCDIEKYGRKKIPIHEALVEAAQLAARVPMDLSEAVAGTNLEFAGNPVSGKLPETEDPQEVEMVEESSEETPSEAVSGSVSGNETSGNLPETSGNEVAGNDPLPETEDDDGELDLDDIDFEHFFDDEDDEVPEPKKAKMKKTGDPQPVSVVKKSPLAGLHEAAANSKDFRS